MERLGYYAKDKDGNLHQFQWGEDDTFYINDEAGELVSNLGHKMKIADAKDYEILEIGFFTADSYEKPIKNNLSFDFEKDFVYSHKNDFDNGNIHYLFGVGVYLFWVDTTNGKVTHVTPTLKEEIDTWYSNSEDESYNVTADEHSIHLMDAMYLNKDYIPKLQKLIDENSYE